MASACSALSEEQFLCSICLDVFTEPVSTPCGHNFCRACISDYWASSRRSQCPLCKQVYAYQPELRVNTGFRDLVEQFRSMSVNIPDEPPAEPGEVPCDVCESPRRKAARSCLVCLASYCRAHLEPHHRVAALRRHQLVEPLPDLEERLCRRHAKPLELFCRHEGICVCVLCLRDDHIDHTTVPLEEECGQRKAQLRQAQTNLEELRQSRQEKLEELQRSLEQAKTTADKEMAEAVEIFSSLVSDIQESANKLFDLIQQERGAVEERAGGLIGELEQEISYLETTGREWERLQHSEDHLHLLQTLSPHTSLTRSPLNRDWDQVRVHSPVCVGMVRSATAPLLHTLAKETQKAVAELRQAGVDAKREEMEDEEEVEEDIEEEEDDLLEKMRRDYGVNVTLDGETANRLLTLSADGKHMRYDRYATQALLDNPKRFSSLPVVLGEDGFSSGRCYYEVEVKGRCWWTLGVVSETADRKGRTQMTPENGFWTIGLYDQRYEANTNRHPIRLALENKVERVGVFVDHQGGEVSFYDVGTKTLMYSFTDCNFTLSFLRILVNLFTGNLTTTRYKVFPFFNNGFDGVPLTITPIHH